MQKVSRPPPLRYGIAVLAVALALPLTLLLSRPEETPSSLFLAAVMVSAWYGGLGPGLLATALSALAYGLFLPPAYTLPTALEDAERLGVFVLVAVLISSLNATRTRLERALRQQHQAKDRFLAVLAHELRTPLSTLRNTLAVLRQAGADHPTREWAQEVLERQIQTMATLVEDLLDVSRIGQGKIRLDKKRVDLATAVAHAAETTRPLVESRRQRLELSLPPGPLYLEADMTQLGQIIVNLLSNACKYTPEGGHIWLTVERSEKEIVLRVRDTGNGLAPEVLPHVFDLFVQAEEGSQGGLGIGLNLVQRLVHLHGGSVAAFSEGLGKGCEFVVRLPRMPDRPADQTTAQPPAPALAQPCDPQPTQAAR